MNGVTQESKQTNNKRMRNVFAICHDFFFAVGCTPCPFECKTFFGTRQGFYWGENALQN